MFEKRVTSVFDIERIQRVKLLIKVVMNKKVLTIRNIFIRSQINALLTTLFYEITYKCTVTLKSSGKASNWVTFMDF